MKTLTFVALLLVVLFACEADAGSFNLSISLDPGFTIGRAHHERRHSARERTEDADTDVDTTNLPNARDVKQFEIPRVFTQRCSNHEDEDNDEDDEVDRHHGGPHRSSHRYG